MDREVKWAMLAAILLLLTPFVIFLTNNDYGYFGPEALAFEGLLILGGLFIGLLSAAGGPLFRSVLIALLLTLFVDSQFNQILQARGILWSGLHLVAVYLCALAVSWLFRRHLSKILVAIFATVLVTTPVIPPDKALPRFSIRTEDRPANPRLPVVIHIVLDEHIGVEGIPTRISGGKMLKEEIKSLYLNNGFRLFGKAFSNFSKSRDSLSNIINLETTPVSNLTRKGVAGMRWEVVGNAVFRRLRERGFRIKIHQTEALNFCKDQEGLLAACYTSEVTSIKPLDSLPISFLEKLRVISGFYLVPMVSYKIVRKIYRWLYFKLGDTGWALPRWDWERTHLAPVPSFGALKRLNDDLRMASRGEYYFAHLLVPHFSYIYDYDCKLRPPSQWLDRWSEVGLDLNRWGQARPGEAIRNTPDTRRLRYQRYFAQVRCVNKRLADLFDDLRRSKIFDKAVIIVHGDHGSRIALHDPDSGRRSPFPRSDIVDNYSTLFAIRAPDIAPGYDLRLLSIQSLFASVIRGDFRLVSGPEGPQAMSTDRLSPGGRGFETRMMNFGEGSDYLP